ncbi:class I SAM-dependent methyltransferase [Streptomyces sp. NPDC048270]|uniref:class I SAM-dependent methyltransferase n=1 Tax=Streptomyces sp. NPDC048270 TaxID=3154615 RepID=UPI0033C1FF7F
MRLLEAHLGPGRGRPALDIGCGDGALTRHLHHQLGYRATGIDCSPTALALAAAAGSADATGPLWRCTDIGADKAVLPEPAYAVITCRLVYRWLDDKGAFVNRVRRLLVPGGVFWVVAEIAGRRKDAAPLQGLWISPAEAEILPRAGPPSGPMTLTCSAATPCTPDRPHPAGGHVDGHREADRRSVDHLRGAPTDRVPGPAGDRAVGLGHR